MERRPISETGTKLGILAILIVLSILVAACGASYGVATSTEAQIDQESAEAQAAEETSLPPTEEPIDEASTPPSGKLLDPCALIPPADVEALFGDPILFDWHRSYWQPSETTRTSYDCQFSDNKEDGVTISVEVFAKPLEALAELESTLNYYNEAFQEEGLKPMDEVSGIGETGYRYTEAPRYFAVPDIYFLSGNYLIAITISPANNANFATALEFAHNALSSLPANITTILPDQNILFDSSGRPPGKPLEPCALITADDAQAFISNPIVSEQSTSSWDSSGPSNYDCIYTDDYSLEGVEILVEKYPNMDLFLGQVSGIVEVSGIGERAFRYNPYNFSDISVVSGNYLINIDVFNASAEETQFQSAFELAELALSRMP